MGYVGKRGVRVEILESIFTILGPLESSSNVSILVDMDSLKFRIKSSLIFSLIVIPSLIEAQERRTFRNDPVPHFPPDKPFSESVCELIRSGQGRFRQWLSASLIAQHSQGKVIDGKTAECLRLGINARDQDIQQVALGVLRGATAGPGVSLPPVHSLAKSEDPTIVREVLTLYENPSFLPGTKDGLAALAPLLSSEHEETSARAARVLAKRNDLGSLLARPEYQAMGLRAGERLLASRDIQHVELGAELVTKTEDSKNAPQIIRKALERSRAGDSIEKQVQRMHAQLLEPATGKTFNPEVFLFKALVELEGLTPENRTALVKLLQDSSERAGSEAARIIGLNPKAIPDVVIEMSNQLKETISSKPESRDTQIIETFTTLHPYPGVELLWRAIIPHGDFESLYGKNSTLNEACLRVGGNARIFGKKFSPEFIKKVIGQEKGYLRRLAIVSFYTPDLRLPPRGPGSEGLPPFVLDILIKDLKSPETATRVATLRALKGLPYVETKLEDEVEQALSDPEPQVAAWAAVRHGKPRVRRIQAGDAFSRALRKALESTDRELSREALSILPRSVTLPPEFEALLIDYHTQQSDLVEDWVNAVTKLEEPSSRLLPLLERYATRSGEVTTSLKALSVISRITGDKERYVQALKTRLQADDRTVHEVYTHLSKQGFCDEQLAPLIRPLKSDRNFMRARALANGCGRYGEAFQILRETLHSSDKFEKSGALSAGLEIMQAAIKGHTEFCSMSYAPPGCKNAVEPYYEMIRELLMSADSDDVVAAATYLNFMPVERTTLFSMLDERLVTEKDEKVRKAIENTRRNLDRPFRFPTPEFRRFGD